MLFTAHVFYRKTPINDLFRQMYGMFSVLNFFSFKYLSCILYSQPVCAIDGFLANQNRSQRTGFSIVVTILFYRAIFTFLTFRRKEGSKKGRIRKLAFSQSSHNQLISASSKLWKILNIQGSSLFHSINNILFWVRLLFESSLLFGWFTAKVER